MKCPMPGCTEGVVWVDEGPPHHIQRLCGHCPNCGPDGWATKWVQRSIEDTYLSYGSSDPSAPPVTDDMLPGESDSFDAIATAARKRLEKET